MKRFLVLMAFLVFLASAVLTACSGGGGGGGGNEEQPPQQVNGNVKLTVTSQ